MLQIDSHTHCVSPDARVPIGEMCRSAMARKVDVLTITDHYELYDPAYPTPSNVFTPAYLEAYWRQYQSCKELFAGKLELYFGLELGQPVCAPKEAAAILARYPFDYVIGSGHKMRNRDLGERDYAPGTARQVLLDNLELLQRMADLGDFDCLGHMDLIRRYSTRAGYPVSLMEEPEGVRTVLASLVRRGKGLEINTSELRHGGGLLPDVELLKLYRELGGELLTVGSDAHCSAHVGGGYRQAVEAAEAAGFRYLCYFRERKPVLFPLDRSAAFH